MKNFSENKREKTKNRKMLSPVSERNAAMVAEEAYGWFSQACVENAECKPMVYETPDGRKVLALGVCKSESLEYVMWEDKVCVGLVKPKTAEESGLEGYMAHMASQQCLRRRRRLDRGVTYE